MRIKDHRMDPLEKEAATRVKWEVDETGKGRRGREAHLAHIDDPNGVRWYLWAYVYSKAGGVDHWGWEVGCSHRIEEPTKYTNLDKNFHHENQGDARSKSEAKKLAIEYYEQNKDMIAGIVDRLKLNKPQKEMPRVREEEYAPKQKPQKKTPKGKEKPESEQDQIARLVRERINRMPGSPGMADALGDKLEIMVGDKVYKNKPRKR